MFWLKTDQPLTPSDNIINIYTLIGYWFLGHE